MKKYRINLSQLLDKGKLSYKNYDVELDKENNIIIIENKGFEFKNGNKFIIDIK